MSKPIPTRVNVPRSDTPRSDPPRHCMSRTLERIPASALPATHPVAMINWFYVGLLRGCEPQHLPDFGEFMQAIGRELLSYCLVLSPVEADPFIDFLVLHKGQRIPGVDQTIFKPGERYSENIRVDLVEERVMELASCLALKQSRHSIAVSARMSTLNVRVYRGVFPVWDGQVGRHTVVLAIAPVYATMDKPTA